MKGSHILSGFIGAAILILVLFAITAWLKPFNYQAVYVVNPEIVTANSLKTDSLTCSHIAVLQDLENKGVLLTPQEYTSHISSYYSTLVAFLIGLFVLFTIGSIYGTRITSRREIEEMKEELKTSLAEELKDSKSFYENIINDILGRLEDDLITKADKGQIDKNIDDITHKQIGLEENINLLFDAVDSKSEIKE
jgi:ABC-type multidrug transport system fused ATPase/permease subunit